MHLRKHSDIDLSRSNPLIFLRHAQSEGQITPSLYRTKGDKNLALTDLGTQQAQTIGKHLADIFHKAGWAKPLIISAESLRTRATAEEVRKAFDLSDITIDARINKQSFGKFDGLLTSADKEAALPELYHAYKDEKQTLGPLKVRPPEGESINDVIERVRNFLQDAAQYGRPVIAATHGLQMLCAEKIAEDLSDEWLLDMQDSTKNVETLTFFPDN